MAVNRADSELQMLTAEEAAALLGVKLGTLYAYVSRGWLKSYRRKVGRQALYRRNDIEALRGVTVPERGLRAHSLPDASSWVTIAQPPTEISPAGVIVAESAVSSISEGKLAYRGYPIEELVERASFEEVCLLLWHGGRPTPAEVEQLREAISAATLPAGVAAALAAVADDAPALLRLAIMLPSLAAAERQAVARARLEQARLIMGALPLALAPGASGAKARSYRRGRIEIIPMIDVMFFLLVTFMLASLSMQSLNAVAVNLPQGEAERLQQKPPATLTITKESRIFVDKTPTDLASLAFVLKPLLPSVDPQVVIAADDAAPEGVVVQAMLQARRAGVEHFLFAVKR